MATFTVLACSNFLYFETSIQANWLSTESSDAMQSIAQISKNLLVGVPVPVYRIF